MNVLLYIDSGLWRHIFVHEMRYAKGATGKPKVEIVRSANEAARYKAVQINAFQHINAGDWITHAVQMLQPILQGTLQTSVHGMRRSGEPEANAQLVQKSGAFQFAGLGSGNAIDACAEGIVVFESE